MAVLTSGSRHCVLWGVGTVSEQRSPRVKDGWVSRHLSLQSISEMPWCTCQSPKLCPNSWTRLSVLPGIPKFSGWTIVPPLPKNKQTDKKFISFFFLHFSICRHMYIYFFDCANAFHQLSFADIRRILKLMTRRIWTQTYNFVMEVCSSLS